MLSLLQAFKFAFLGQRNRVGLTSRANIRIRSDNLAIIVDNIPDGLASSIQKIPSRTSNARIRRVVGQTVQVGRNG